MQIERVLLFDLDIFLKNFLQDITNGKFPATARSHGHVGFHALLTGIPGGALSTYTYGRVSPRNFQGSINISIALLQPKDVSSFYGISY